MTEPQPTTFPNLLPFLRPELLANPYPIFAMLRATQPVMRVPLPGSEAGVCVLSRHEDVQFVLRDPRFSVDRRRSDFFQRNRELLPPALVQALIGDQGGLRSMLLTDPPDHTRLRRLVSTAFTPRRVAELRPRIQAILDELIAPLAGARQSGGVADSPADIVADIAGPLPAIVIAELLGVPAEDRSKFKEWSDDLVLLLGSPDPQVAIPRFQRALESLLDYLQGIVTQRRRQPEDDLISAMISAQEERDALSDGEILATSNLLLVAGHETTTNLIGNGLLALLRHPDQLARLRREPERLPGAIEEMLRYDSPVQLTIRVPTEPVEIGSVRVDANGLVIALIAAANRDPAVFAEPDSFDITRPENPHLSFGFGVHFCLGASLARLEAEIAFRTLLERFPAIELAADDIAYQPNFVLRGLASLPVRLRG